MGSMCAGWNREFHSLACGPGVGRQSRRVSEGEMINLLRRFSLVADHRREIEKVQLSAGKGCKIERE